MGVFKSLFFILFPIVLFSQTISIKRYQWQLIGFPYEVNVSKLNLKPFDILWSYKNDKWYCYAKQYDSFADEYGCEKFERLEAGSGVWIGSRRDYDLIVETDKEERDKILYSGWNLVTFKNKIDDINQTLFQNKGAKYIWGYKNNKWQFVSSDGLKIDGIENLKNIDKYQGIWVYLQSFIKLNSKYLKCSNGKCLDITMNNNSNLKFALKLANKNYSNVKIGIDLHRYGNNTNYKFAFGPFSIVYNKELLGTDSIPVCVSKKNSNSCKKISNKEKFAYISDGFLIIDSQKIASLFSKSIPNAKERFKVKFYIYGMDINGFVSDDDFGTLGIENFNIWVKIVNNKSITFDLEFK